jgi:hypothetical protein
MEGREDDFPNGGHGDQFRARTDEKKSNFQVLSGRVHLLGKVPSNSKT